MKTRYKWRLFPLKTALFCNPTAWSRWTHVHQEMREINQEMKGRRGKPLHGCPVMMGWICRDFLLCLKWHFLGLLLSNLESSNPGLQVLPLKTCQRAFKEKQGEDKRTYHDCSTDSEIRQAYPNQSGCSNTTSCLTSQGFCCSVY